MSLQLILGGSGSGKSFELYKNIINASVQSPGTQFLVIVPEQFTMQTQKELVRLHPNRGIMNIDILSFQRLCHRIFEEVGEDKRTVLEDMGKTLLLRRVVSKHQDKLKVLRANLRKKGYLAEVKSLISEFAQYDITDEKMEKMLQVSETKPQLYYKLADIATLYRGFREELQGKYITAEETLDALCQVADRSRILKDCVIALDGFTGFTPIQEKVLKKLMMLAKQVYVTLTIDPKGDCFHVYHEHELFFLSKNTIRTLYTIAQESDCEILEPVFMKQSLLPRFKEAQAIGFLEKRLFRNRKRETFSEIQEDEISLHTAQNPVAELHYIGRTIRKLVREGYRYQEMAIIVGNLEAYANYLPDILKQYEVPVFMDQTRAIFSNPFIEFIRAVFSIQERNYDRDSVFRYLRTGLCGLNFDEVDRLENYCLEAGIKGKQKWHEPFTKQVSFLTETEVQELDALRESFIAPLDVFYEKSASGNSAQEMVLGLYELICHYGIQKQLSEYEAYFQEEGQLDLSKEYSQVYALVLGLFDKIVELLGQERISIQEFREMMDTGFEEMKVGIIPPSADLVQVGNIERTRLKDIKILFFAGLNDGYVPAGKDHGGLLSDMEREILGESRVKLAPTARMDSYIQRFYLYLNLTKPSQRLYLSYSKAATDGAIMKPSYILHTFRTMFPTLELIDEDKCGSIVERSASPQAGLHYLVEGLQGLRMSDPDEKWMELYNWYRRQPEYRDKVEQLLDAVFFTFTEEGIGREAARELYGEALVNSVSRLEKYAGCAFMHFLEYGLQLEERKEYSFRPADFGQIIHRVVELFSRRMEENGYDWKLISEEQRNTLMDECVDQVTADYGQKILHSTCRNEYMIQRIRRIMRRTGWALQKQLQAGSFYPSDMEVVFSQAGNLDAINIALTDEEKMRLKGRIDRIDICEKEDQIYVKVIDYKSGNKDFDLLAFYHGLQLQLVVYLNAATELKKKSFPGKEIIPAGIFYYHVDDPMLGISDELTPEEINEKLLEELRLQGIVNDDPEVFREMDAGFEKKSSVIPITLKADGTLAKVSKGVSTKQFHMLTSFVTEKMKELGNGIMQGEISAVPYERGQKTGCDYCIYKEICRRDESIPGTHTRRLKEYSEEQIWERMEIQENGNTVDERTE